MANNEIAAMYQGAFQREQASRTALRGAVTAIGNARGEYDLGAMAAEERAEEVLDNIDNGLSPSERADWGDRLRLAHKTRAYSQI